MSKTDYETYTSLYEAMVMTPYFPHPDVLIYIEGSLPSILTRINERGREMEIQTDVSYWEHMHGRYSKWINEFTACPVLRLNIDDYDVNDETSMSDILVKVGEAIRKPIDKI
jgi:deoxyadenosine/deoxycytidine kinase